MALISHGPGTPLFITPNFSHVRPPAVEAPYTASPGLYALVAVAIVLFVIAASAVAWWLARRRKNATVAISSPNPLRNLRVAPRA